MSAGNPSAGSIMRLNVSPDTSCRKNCTCPSRNSTCAPLRMRTGDFIIGSAIVGKPRAARRTAQRNHVLIDPRPRVRGIAAVKRAGGVSCSPAIQVVSGKRQPSRRQAPLAACTLPTPASQQALRPSSDVIGLNKAWSLLSARGTAGVRVSEGALTLPIEAPEHMLPRD